MDFELSQEQKMLMDMARKFAEQEIMPALKDYERQEKQNDELIRKMAPLGLLGFNIPREYGGLELDYISWAIIWEQLSGASWSVATSTNSSILAGTVIMAAGSKEQKKEWLPAICKGKKDFAVAAVEPNAGSDAAAIETRAVLRGDKWIINGSKTFISHGTADVVLVLVQTDKSKGTRGIAMIAVDKDTPGFSATEIHGKVGYRAANLAQIGFNDCEVPGENLMGEIGRGLGYALAGINNARFSIATGCVGMAQCCLEACIKYTRERYQFNRPIASFQLVQEKIAEMAAQIDVMRNYVYYLGYLKNKGIKHVKETSYAKYQAAELAMRASAEAIQLHGAYGCVDDYPVEHHYRDAILTTILGGTANIHKLTIGRELLGINAISQ